MNLTLAVVRHVVWKSDTREEEIKRGITVIPMITVMTAMTVITMITMISVQSFGQINHQEAVSYG